MFLFHHCCFVSHGNHCNSCNYHTLTVSVQRQYFSSLWKHQWDTVLSCSQAADDHSSGIGDILIPSKTETPESVISACCQWLERATKNNRKVAPLKTLQASVNLCRQHCVKSGQLSALWLKLVLLSQHRDIQLGLKEKRRKYFACPWQEINRWRSCILSFSRIWGL